MPLIGGFAQGSFWKPIGEETWGQLRAWPWHAASILTNHESVSAADPSHWWVCSGKLLEANRRGEAGTAQGLALARSLNSNLTQLVDRLQVWRPLIFMAPHLRFGRPTKKWKNLVFCNAGCFLRRTTRFSCSLKALHEGRRIGIFAIFLFTKVPCFRQLLFFIFAYQHPWSESGSGLIKKLWPGSGLGLSEYGYATLVLRMVFSSEMVWS